MKLPLPIGKKALQSNYFLSLVLRHEHVSAVIFEETGGKVKIVGSCEVPFPKNIEDATLDELLDTIDQALSTAEEGLPENVETRKTVFGVKETWVKDAKIKPEYLSKLKKVSDELNLEPIGFLTVAEAIAHLLQKEEGAPVSAVLVETGKHVITATLLRAGKVGESKTAAPEGNIVQAVDTLLKHFSSVEVLPSRLIIFDGETDLSQEFIAHQWSKNLPFLHMPQILSLPNDFDAKAVLYGTATQMGFTFLPDVPLPKQQSKEKPLEETNPGAGEKEEEKEQETHHAPEPTHAFGFSEGVDVGKLQQPTLTPAVSSPRRFAETIAEIPEGMALEEEKQPLGSQGMLLKTGGLKIVQSLLGSFSNLTHLKKGKRMIPMKGKALLFVSVAAILLTGALVFYFFGVSATILLSLQPKTLQKTATLTFAADASTSISDNVIASEFVSVSEDGAQSAPATGKKTIGDKAKGKVTIFNNNDSSKTIPSGTTLTSLNGLQFTTDSDVTIASASGDVFSGTKPGTTDVTVTASTFGTEYNLPSGTKFSISGSATIAAKNDNAFSGGTKKDVTVVSKDDEQKLLDGLEKSLSDKAHHDFSAKLTSDKQALENAVSSSFSKQSFDKNAGDQATQVTLTATLSYQGIAYKKKDLQSYAKQLLQHDIPQNVTISDTGLTVQTTDTKVKNDKEVQASVNIQAKLLPVIDTTTLAKQIAGTSYDQAQKTITALPQIGSVTITASPHLPFLPKTLPHAASRIHIILQNE